MESAASGCATITSQKGGLMETFKNDLYLKIKFIRIFKMIDFLIKNPKKLRYHQLRNFKNPVHLIENLVSFLTQSNSIF